MGCRIGITTDPAGRRAYWESQCQNLRNWQILERHATKTAAQNAENRLRAQYGCDGAAGGGGPEYGDWSVYYFQHDGCW